MDEIEGHGNVRVDIGRISSSSLIQRRPSSGSLSMIEEICRKSFSSYRKLPQDPLKLSVLKLDGSSFNIEVTRTATVSDLKDAVESVFSDMHISWKHLWGRFCLTHGDQKLVVETEYIAGYGIKDGDELHFIRHVSDTPYLGRKASRKRMPRSSSYEDKIKDRGREDICDIETGIIKHRKSVDDLRRLVGSATPPSSQGPFTYTKLSLAEDKDDAEMNCRSNCTETFWSRFRKIMVFCGRAPPYSQKDSWRED
ncbi:hypothetical protein MLD38_006130 [Melastoma candidum]|uniref:Uncharacterized protein n=1 Tax=Melastoma candidum TaxID=119954 RepID=A0ACB9RLL2_9MYRT|nr:hypothetical protein MLD38_006130 [Melastoma candidum]